MLTGSESVVRETVISPRSGLFLLQRSHAVRRYLGWAAAGMVLVLICLPIGLWIHYQSVNVMSRNAMVRGHLAELGTRLNGVLASIEVAEGERVVKGQILARFEDRHIRSEAREVQAELEGLEQELKVEQLAIVHEQRFLDNKLLEAVANQKAAAAEVTAAKSRADNARQRHALRKSLLGSHAISREVVRNADAKRRTEQAMVDVAKENHTAARSAAAAVRLEAEGIAIRKQRVGIIKANVLRAKARLEGVNADLDSSLIRAPNDGAVVRWLVQPGGSVKVGIPVVSMWLGNDVWIEAWIDEDEIAKVQIGSEATVTLQSFPGREFSAVVDKIGLTTDFQMPASEDIIPQPRFTRLRGAPVVGVLVRLLNPPEELLPGLSAVVAIHDFES